MCVFNTVFRKLCMVAIIRGGGEGEECSIFHVVSRPISFVRSVARQIWRTMGSKEHRESIRISCGEYFKGKNLNGITI